jgi:hypothetical protein
MVIAKNLQVQKFGLEIASAYWPKAWWQDNV